VTTSNVQPFFSRSQGVRRSGYGLLHGGTVRTEVVKSEESIMTLKILKYKLRKTSIILQGPMNALHVLQVRLNENHLSGLLTSIRLQTLSKHVREEVARNYLMSESILHSIQCAASDKYSSKCYTCKDKATSSLIRHISPELFRKYVFECCQGSTVDMSESIELELPKYFFDCFDQHALENAAEAAIKWYVRKMRLKKDQIFLIFFVCQWKFKIQRIQAYSRLNL
jgi:hypothetical protein